MEFTQGDVENIIETFRRNMERGDRYFK